MTLGRVEADTSEVDQYPRGYPRLAAFQRSDPDFAVYRRFNTLHQRVILHRQQELVKLERQLNDLDRTDARETPYRLASLEWDHEDALQQGKEQSEREDIINKIEIKLKNYGETHQ